MPRLQLEPVDPVEQLGARLLADRLDRRVGGKRELGALERHRSAAAALVGLAERHLRALDRRQARSPEEREPAPPGTRNCTPSSRASSTSCGYAGISALGAPVDERHLVGTEPQRLASDVDRRVAAADHDDAASDARRPSGLDRLDERQRVPDAVRVVAGIAKPSWSARARPRGRPRRRFVSASSCCRLDRVPEPKLDAELAERRLVGKRIAELAVRSDREADEPADLVALVDTVTS